MDKVIASGLITAEKSYVTTNRLGYVLHMIFEAYIELNREVPTGVVGSPLGSISKDIPRT